MPRQSKRQRSDSSNSSASSTSASGTGEEKVSKEAPNEPAVSNHTDPSVAAADPVAEEPQKRRRKKKRVEQAEEVVVAAVAEESADSNHSDKFAAQSEQSEPSEQSDNSHKTGALDQAAAAASSAAEPLAELKQSDDEAVMAVELQEEPAAGGGANGETSDQAPPVSTAAVSSTDADTTETAQLADAEVHKADEDDPSVAAAGAAGAALTADNSNDTAETVICSSVSAEPASSARAIEPANSADKKKRKKKHRQPASQKAAEAVVKEAPQPLLASSSVSTTVAACLAQPYNVRDAFTWTSMQTAIQDHSSIFASITAARAWLDAMLTRCVRRLVPQGDCEPQSKKKHASALYIIKLAAGAHTPITFRELETEYHGLRVQYRDSSSAKSGAKARAQADVRWLYLLQHLQDSAVGLTMDTMHCVPYLETNGQTDKQPVPRPGEINTFAGFQARVLYAKPTTTTTADYSPRRFQELSSAEPFLTHMHESLQCANSDNNWRVRCFHQFVKNILFDRPQAGQSGADLARVLILHGAPDSTELVLAFLRTYVIGGASAVCAETPDDVLGHRIKHLPDTILLLCIEDMAAGIDAREVTTVVCTELTGSLVALHTPTPQHQCQQIIKAAKRRTQGDIEACDVRCVLGGVSDKKMIMGTHRADMHHAPVVLRCDGAVRAITTAEFESLRTATFCQEAANEYVTFLSTTDFGLGCA